MLSGEGTAVVAVCKRRWYKGIISSQDVIKYHRDHLGCLGETDGGGLGLCGAGGITRVGRWKPEKEDIVRSHDNFKSADPNLT